MNQLAKELDEKLRTLDPARAQNLASRVRELLDRAGQHDSASGWPDGYFEQTAGACAGEEFERPPQGELTMRDAW